MAAATSQQPQQPSNWLSEWNQRTPLITKAAIFAILPITTLCLLIPSMNSALSLTPAAFTKGHIWRLVTSLVDQGQFFALLFVVLMLAMQAPATERSMGSLRFLISMLWLGLVINVLYATLSSLLYSFASSFSNAWFGPPISQGLWPVFMAVLTINALADPTGSSTFCCLTLPNRLFPWFLLLLFSLFAFSLQLDLTVGVLLGHAFAYLRPVRYWLSPSHARLTRWEAGWATRIGLTRASGYVPLPATGAIQAGDHNTQGGGASASGWENPFSSFTMFGATNRQRQEQAEQRARQQQGGDAEAGSAGGFHVFRGLRPVGASAATTSAGGTSTAGTSTGTSGSSTWGSGGNVLGSSSSTSSSPSAPAPSAPQNSAAAMAADEARIASIRAATLARLQQQQQQKQGKPASPKPGASAPPASAPGVSPATASAAAATGAAAEEEEVDLLGLGADDHYPDAETGEGSRLLGTGKGAGARVDTVPLIPSQSSAASAAPAPHSQAASVTTAVRTAPAPQATSSPAPFASAPPSGSAGSSALSYAAGIRDLVALGFGAQEAAAALAKTGGDVDAAAVILFEAEEA